MDQNYYADGLAYQQHINRMKTSQNLPQKVIWKVTPQRKLLIRFPQFINPEEISGKIHLFRPSDARQDRFVPVHLEGDRMQTISVKHMASGKWRLKIEWKTGKREFYDEGVLVLK